MYDARDIANYILDSAETRGRRISHLALQKLLYFIHGWFSSINNAPLIRNKFEAWKYGPVQRVFYDQFKSSSGNLITTERAKFLDPQTGRLFYKTPVIDERHRMVIEEILKKYEFMTASQLVEKSHVEDGPWEYVWRKAEEKVYPGMQIPEELIRQHFKSLKPIFTVH